MHSFRCRQGNGRNSTAKKVSLFCHSNWFSVELIVLLCNFPFRRIVQHKLCWCCFSHKHNPPTHTDFETSEIFESNKRNKQYSKCEQQAESETSKWKISKIGRITHKTMGQSTVLISCASI